MYIDFTSQFIGSLVLSVHVILRLVVLLKLLVDRLHHFVFKHLYHALLVFCLHSCIIADLHGSLLVPTVVRAALELHVFVQTGKQFSLFIDRLSFCEVLISTGKVNTPYNM